MLPTTDVQPLSHPLAAPVRPAPAPIRALRVVAGVEILLLAVGVAFGLGAAILAAPGLADSGEGASWAMAFVVFGLIFAGLCLTLALAVGIPLRLLRDGRPGRRTGALTTLVVVHGLVGLGALMTAVTAAANVAPASAFLPLLVAGVTVTVTVLALQPAGQAWAKNG